MSTLECSYCHHALAPGSDICDNCGAVLSSITYPSGNVSLPTTCPSCHNPLTPGSDICDHCGAIVSQSTQPTTSAPVTGSSSFTTCPVCQAPLMPGSDICNNCGAIISSHATQPPQSPPPVQTPPPAEEQEQCPQCGKVRIAGRKFCGGCGYEFPEQAETLTTGSVLNARYRLVKVIGSGGMGSVYLAWDLVLKRRVVIKGLINSADPDLAAQSVMEREFLARINHSNIVAIYDFITLGNHGYIVMEYVDGKTLDQLLEERGGPFDVPTAIEYILRILPAFAYLAKLNLVYCDFKPQNVMVGQLKDGTQILKLIDLGTVIPYGPKPQRVYGTNGFYARQAIKSPSPQTDLYSICRTLAYLVTMMDLDDPIFGMPPASKYPIFQDNPSLYTLLQKGTHDDPVRRFQSAEELEEQLRGVLRLCKGGTSGVPVNSQHFVSAALTNTGRVGRRGETMLDENDRAINLLRQGDQALQIANYVGAEAFYQQAKQVNPQSLDAHARAIDLLIEQGNLVQADNELTVMQRLSLTHWKVQWCEGRILEAREQWARAEVCYLKVIFDQPGELPPLQALARVYAHQGKDSETIRLYQSVLKADPGNVDATFGLVECLLRQQHWSEAIDSLSKISEAAARYAEAQLLLCDIFLNQSTTALPGAQQLQNAAHVVSRLKGRTDDARYYLTHAEVYYMAWHMARSGQLPPTTKFPDAPNAHLRTLGAVANKSYTEYLKREQELAPREDILQRKFEVAPWHVF